ncbi:hypothetical protein GCM10022271_08310 [Corallibacter vietnamensis]|uniref:Uncharacterized protein n=1 Tax=Corallibacter vietnamensis TaxID=904130 RepID=A0ABP7GYU4_9FLAO
MRSFIAFFFCLLCYTSIAQNAWLQSSNYHFETHPVSDIAPVVNKETRNIALFYKVKKGYVAELYNDKKELLYETVVSNISSGDLVGCIYEKNTYTLFFSNRSKSKIGCVKIDFTTGTYTVIKDLNLSIKGEKAIQFITDENKLHLLTVEKKKSILKLYSFNVQGGFIEKSYDLSDEVFESDNELTYSLYSFLYVINKLTKFEFIDNSLPCSLEQASLPTKIFSQDGHVFLTINLTSKFTYIIKLSLKEPRYDFKKITNESFKKGNYYNTHNSFLLGDKLFEAYITNERFVMDIIDLESQKSLKQFSITEKDSIYFKNTPIIQEGGDFDNYREFEKTTKFIRKILYSKMALSVYKLDANYVVTIGSYEPKPGAITMVGAMVGGLTGAIIFSMFDSYSNSKSVKILSLLDSNFNHVQGDIPDNKFDAIHSFIEDKKLKEMSAQTVFKYDNLYIWGFYSDVSKMYKFYSF